jgi:hypothetical protein
MNHDLFERLKLGEFLRSRYKEVELKRYRNIFSRWYESFREDNSGSFIPENNLPLRAVNKVLFMIESVSSVAQFGNMVLINCSESMNEEISKLSILDPNLEN